MKIKNLGISLISLIITIIVIIILAAIVIFSGLGTPDSANFAKFASEFSDFGTAITNDFMNRKAEYALDGKTRTDKQIYYMIASGTEIDMNDEPIAVAGLEELGLSIMPEEIQGTEYYEITSDNNVENWKKEKYYYAKDEKHYVTDKGEVFILPGYLQEDNGTKKWWINERKYYVSDKPIKSEININITIDAGGTTAAGTNIEEGTALYINFDTSGLGDVVDVSPSLPYVVTTNGTYEFTLTFSDGSTKIYKVTINNYKKQTLADMVDIGDYVEYEGDSTNSYTLYMSKTGDTNNDGIELKPESTKWRVWKEKADGTVIIVPKNPVNVVSLQGDTGFINSLEIMEAICDLYTNSDLGVTASDVRSMKIEDLEDIRVATNIDRYSHINYGKTNAEINGNSGYISGKFYVEADGLTIIKTPNVASSTNPIVLKQTYYYNTNPLWNSLSNSKFGSETYGTLLGYTWGWLASPWVGIDSERAGFGMRYAHINGIDGAGLYRSDGGIISWELRSASSDFSTFYT